MRLDFPSNFSVKEALKYFISWY